MTPTHIILTPEDSIISLMQKIASLSPVPKSITLDIHNATFEIGYDFFVLLTRRFPSVQFSLLSWDSSIANIASGFGIKVSNSNATREFEEQYAKKYTNLLRHNFTTWEYFLYEVRKFFEYFVFLAKRKPNLIYKTKNRVKNTNFVLMIFGLVMSLSLLLFIFYFAVSRTIITVSPKVSVKPITANVIFTSTEKSPLDGKNVLEMRGVSTLVSSQMKFRVTALDMNAVKNSQGTITVTNELSSEQSMKPNTRFITDDGLVFRSIDWIRVPGSRNINGIASPWTVDITVVADTHDEKNELIGEKGNIPDGTVLTIPWLKFNRDKIYAKSKWRFTGGENPKLHVITQDEMDSFSSVFREQLRVKAKEDIQKRILEENKNMSREFSLLLADTITYSDDSITLLHDAKIGDYAEEVELSGSVRINAQAFDKRATINYLVGIFREKLLQWTDKELGINEDSLRVSNVIERSEDASRIKVTVEMNAITTYDFENATNELTRQLKSIIIWLPAEEAKTRLMNDGHVGNIKIRFSPFWMRSVSSNPDNIDFVIERTK